MRQTFEIFKPRGFKTFTTTIESSSAGTMTLEGKTDAFSFTLKRGTEPLIRYEVDSDFVDLLGTQVPIEYGSWRHWKLGFILNGRQYTHKFKKLNLLKYSLHNSIVCDGKQIAELYSIINSQILFFKTGGRVTMELDAEIPFVEPLFYAIAWWWTGYYTDDTCT